MPKKIYDTIASANSVYTQARGYLKDLGQGPITDTDVVAAFCRGYRVCEEYWLAQKNGPRTKKQIAQDAAKQIEAELARDEENSGKPLPSGFYTRH